METGPPPKRHKPNARDFLLKQRFAKTELRDLLDVSNVDYIRQNGTTYEYVIWITALILKCAQPDIKIYRCEDGLFRDDYSSQWEEIAAEESLRSGVHMFTSTNGSHEFSVKLTEGIVETVDVDPIFCVSGAGMKGLAIRSSPSRPQTPTGAAPTTPTPGIATPSLKSLAIVSPAALQIMSLPRSVLFHFISVT